MITTQFYLLLARTRRPTRTPRRPNVLAMMTSVFHHHARFQQPLHHCRMRKFVRLRVQNSGASLGVTWTTLGLNAYD